VAATSRVTANVVPEGVDWFTAVLGQPRDMSSSSQVRWVENLYRPAIVDGQFKTDVGPNGKLSILYPGMGPGALNETAIGATRPINANSYRRLVVRAHVAEAVRLFVWGFRHGYDEHAVLVGDTTLAAGWGTYVIGLNGSWNGTQQGLSLVFPDGAQDLRIDWVRLLRTTDVSWVTARWQPVGRRSVDVLIDDNRDPLDGFVHTVGTGLLDDGQESWSPDILPPGRYFVYVRRAGSRPATGSYAGSPVRVEPTPILRFAIPSWLSGEDYATRELKNPWDMNGPDDLFAGGDWRWSWHGLSSAPIFRDGALHASNSGRDPYFFLNVDPNRPIDTSRYRYLSWRWRVDAPRLHSPQRLDAAHGLMTRFHYYGSWPYRGDSMNTSNDVLIWDGWNIYTVDLWRGHLDDASPGAGPGWSGMKAGLRFDPLEATQRFDFQVDWIRLTADHYVRAGSDFRIHWSQRPGTLPQRVRLYIDTDDDWDNGTHAFIGEAYRASSGGVSPGATAGHRVYLPLASASRAARWFAWHVPRHLRGRFHIAAEVSNGFTTTHWYSSGQVLVVP
jgi:hypothetical protein